MGYICEIKCNSCGAVSNMRLGQGKRDYVPDNVKSHFNDKSIIAALEKAVVDDALWNFEWKLGICESCRKMVCVPVLTVQDATENERCYVENCSCGNRVESLIDWDSIGENSKEVRCVTCGGDLECARIGFWD